MLEESNDLKVIYDSCQTPYFNLKENFAKKKKIEWFSISEKGFLLYQFNTNEFGICFSDGTGFLKIKSG